MNILFIHQNFPGQYKLLAQTLANRKSEHRVVCLGDSKNLASLKVPQGLEVLGYQAREDAPSQAHHYLHSTETAIRRGQDVVRACQQLKSKGFIPDVVVGHPAWGELLFIKDVFPATRLIAYFEFFYKSQGSDVGFDPEFSASRDVQYKIRIRNTVQLQGLAQCDAGVSPTQWQKSTFPKIFHPLIHVIHEGLDLNALRPNPNATFTLPDGKTLDRQTKVITFVSRQLEPYRGFHTFMRALPELQRRLPGTHFVIVGADGVSYGGPPPKGFANYREWMMKEVGDSLDLSRTHFVGRIPYQSYVSLLQISRLHIYLTYPFVLSWSMLEAMACGAPVLASATPPVQEIIQDNKNGYLFDFFDQEQLISRAVTLSENPSHIIRSNARKHVEENFNFIAHSLPKYEKLMFENTA